MQRWEGEGLFFDGRVSRAWPAEIAIDADGVTLQVGGQVRRLRPKDFKVSDAEADGFFRLMLQGAEGASVELRSREALRLLGDLGWARGQSFAAWPLPIRAALLAVGFLLIAVFIWLYGLDFATDKVVHFIPKNLERTIGHAAFQQLVESQKLVEDSLTLKALDRCSQAIRPLSPTADSVYIALVDEPSIHNAFALPGGPIVLYRGILKDMEDQGELMGLLAHELGHIHHRHGLRQLTRTMLLGVATSLLFGDFSGIGSVLVDNSALLLNLGYSRDHEREADRFALEGLTTLGLDASGLERLFGRMETDEHAVQRLAFLSTHPANSERRELFRNAAAGEPVEILTPQEFDRIKKGHGEGGDSTSIEASAMYSN